MRRVVKVASIVSSLFVVSILLFIFNVVPYSSEQVPDISILQRDWNIAVADLPAVNQINRGNEIHYPSLVTSEDTPIIFSLLSGYNNNANMTNSSNGLSPLSFLVSTPPSHGELQDSTGSYDLIYSPDPNYNGEDHFAITFIEGIVQARTISFSVSVTPINDPPIAKNFFVSTTKNKPIMITLLSNDIDVDGGDDGISIVSMSNPENGKIESQNGSIQYNPDHGFVGRDSFTYVLDDSDGTLSEPGMIAVLVQDLATVNTLHPDHTDTQVVPPTQINATDDRVNNDLPIARAGQDQSVKEGVPVTLDGSASSDPDGMIISYYWEQLRNSDQAPQILLDAVGDNRSPSVATFTSPNTAEGLELAFKLTILDDDGNSSSDVVSIWINPATNNAPSANAGNDLKVQEKEDVVLDGSNSVDSDGDSLSFSWSQEDSDQTSVLLHDENSSSPSFTAPNVGRGSETLTFTLRVDDNHGGVDFDTVKVSVSNINRPPEVIVSQNQTVGEAIYVRLDGTRSNDPDKDQLSYYWQQLEGPEVQLSNPVSSKPTFKTPTTIAGSSQTLIFSLMVSDGVLTSFDSVEIIVEDTIKPPQILKTGEFRKDLIREIDQAEKLVHVSMFYVEAYDKNRVLDALERATERGVDVRIAFAEQNFELNPTIEKDLIDRGLTYKVVANHAKIIIIDDKIVYVGSANLNRNGLDDNWELTVKSNNLDTVREAKQFINLGWNSGSKIVQYNNYDEENFANGSEYFEMLMDQLHNAKKIRMIMYEATYDFKDDDRVDTIILDTLKEAYDDGAEVELLFDNPRYYEAYGGKQFLTRNDIPHKVDDKSTGTLERLHAKAILIDDDILFIGSQNFNDDSLDSSAEAAIVTRNPDTIAQFLTIFNEKWIAGTYMVEPE